MISVEQVRALEERVEKAIAYIASLKSENADLRRDLETAREAAAAAASRVAGLEMAREEANAAASRIAELEAAAEAYRRDQASIEAGIVHALQKLDAFEDLVLRAETQGSGAPASAPAAAPEAAPQASPAAPATSTPLSATQQAKAQPKPQRPETVATAKVPEVAVAAIEEMAVEPEGEDRPTAMRTADELSLEELEAATAPAKTSEPASAQPAELDIF